MKTNFILIGLSIVFAAACDPLGLGFKKNPAWVLDTAFKAINNLDHERFLEISGKEALCLYGNPDGVMHLKENLVLDEENAKIDHTVLSAKHYRFPVFVGFWTYYSANYIIDIHDKKTEEYVLQAVIECNYGTEGAKDEKLVHLDPKKYKKKECRLTKVIPQTFTPLEMSARCEMLKVAI